MKLVKFSLDTASITKAMRELQNYAEGAGKGTVTGIVNEKIQRVVDAAVKAAVLHYKSSSTAVRGYQLNSNTWIIEAVGDQVTFLEFGAGFYANHGYAAEAEDLGFVVYSGSWSDWHAGKWHEWIAANKNPRKFPFNRKPRRGMYWAVRAAKTEIRKMTK